MLKSIRALVVVAPYLQSLAMPGWIAADVAAAALVVDVYATTCEAHGKKLSDPPMMAWDLATRLNFDNAAVILFDRPIPTAYLKPVDGRYFPPIRPAAR